MSIRKRTWDTKDGPKAAWVVDYRDQDENRCLKTFNRKKDATAWWEGQATTEITKGTHTPDSKSITVAEAGELWIAQCETGNDGEDPLEASSIRQYRQHLDLHIKPLLAGRLKLNALSVATVKAFSSRLREEGRSPQMVKKVITSLGTLLADAQDRGKVSRNVVREMRGRRKKRGKRHQRHLEVGKDIPTKDELRAIIEAAEGSWRPLVITAIFTGLRASELRGLSWDGVDFDEGVIRVSQRADRFNEIGSPKSGASRRDVPMAPIVKNTLLEWKLKCPKGDLGLVFPNGKGNVEFHSNVYRRGFGSTQLAAKITDDPDKPKYGPHAFRHAAASLFIEQAFTPKRVQVVMGHSSIQITYDIYGHLFPSPEDDARAMEQIEARLLG